MLRDKRFYFLLFLTILLRLTVFLFRGSPGGDEVAYFDQALKLMTNGPDWKGMEYIQAAPKLLFIIINAPIVNFLFRMTGNAGLSVSVLPLVLSVAGLFAVYALGRRLYGPRGAYWAGLVYSVMPYLVLESCLMTAEKYYIVFYVFGALMLNDYFRNRKTRSLVLTMLWFAAICKVRPDGIIIFLIAAFFLILSSMQNR